MNVAGPETRKVTVLINVPDAKRLPQVGGHLAKFLTALTKDHGLFTVEVALSVEPTQYTAFGAAEMPPEESEFEIVFTPEKEEDG